VDVPLTWDECDDKDRLPDSRVTHASRICPFEGAIIGQENCCFLGHFSAHSRTLFMPVIGTIELHDRTLASDCALFCGLESL